MFDRHHPAVYRYLRRIVGDSGVAEDLTQEVFLRVVRGLGAYSHDGRAAAWVFQIARNLALNALRDRGRRPVATQPEVVSEPSARASQALTLDLDRALSTLPFDDRECFLLRELGGLSYAEIGAVCALTPDAVRSRIHRARLALREALAQTESARPGRRAIERTS